MKRFFIFIYLLGVAISMTYAQSISTAMENAVKICKELSQAIASPNTSSLQAYNKAFRAAEIENFGDLSLVKGKDKCLDGHFIFDEDFIDQIITDNKVISFSSKYAKRRNGRGSSGKANRIRLTTKAIKAGQSCTWKTVNRRIAEYALVAENGGLFTMTIKDEKGKVLYAETVDNKKGAPIRKARIQLPDKSTRILIEIKNYSNKDASFALIGN